jgi:heptosyltransferase III
MKDPQNLLIVRTDRIGDVVLSLPLAAVIKKRFPSCRITLLLREYTKPLAEGNPHIDEIITLHTEKGKISLRKNIYRLREKKFDTAIVVYPTFRSSLVIFFSRIKKRIGTGYRWYSFLFNHKTYEHRKNAEKHELEYNLGLLEHIGIKNIPLNERSNFHIRSNTSAREKAGKILKEYFNSNNHLIIIHPGSGGSAVDLPAEKFKELIDLISRNTLADIVITGSKDEFDLCEYLVTGNNAVNLSGKFNLSELIALIEKSSLFIANSTGPLHIAAALGKNVIGFYPKVVQCSAKRWGPYSQKSVIFEPELDCKKCTVEQCIKLNCMNTIDMNNVFDKTAKILKLLPSTGETDANN